MSEAIIARRGGKSEGSSPSSGRLVTEIYTTNNYWVVPNNAINNTFSVRLFGGGGAGFGYIYQGSSDTMAWHGGGGGGGWMNNGEFNLTPGSLVEIIIGKGGKFYGSNNIYSGVINDSDFEDGAIRAESGETSFFGIHLSANGGGAGFYDRGGSGGAGGGGTKNGGTGYQFGGGGGSYGGNGGPWGGGGGGSEYGIGGIYGGNGGKIAPIAENGTNTVGWTNVAIELNGSYITGEGSGGMWYGGGGGFGGNGGTGDAVSIDGGGGGGYGADGGNASYNITDGTRVNIGHGGGGGYGKGGYGGTSHGGGGAYGRGGSLDQFPTFGGGGCGKAYGNFQNGADGICIIQYYSI